MSVATKLLSSLNIKLALRFSYRHCSTRSCVFISGKYGTGLASTVIPDVDIEHDLQSQNLEENLLARKIDSQKFDLKSILMSAKYLDWLDTEDTRLENERKEIAQKILQLPESELKETLKAEARTLKQVMKSVTRDRWAIEDSAVLDYFNLPNRLSDRTPREADLQIHTFGSSIASSRSHVNIAIESKELEVTPYSSASFYLFGRLAKLELDLSQRMQDHLHDAGLEMMACPDFVRSVVLEGCEVVTFQHPDNFLSLAETSDLGSIKSGHGVHLTGGASLYPFIGYFTKNVVTNPAVLPVNYFCIGRQYQTQKVGKPFSMFRSQQSTAVHSFSGNDSLKSMEAQLDNHVQVLKEFYDNLGLHYRIVLKSASELGLSQSHKASFEMFSPSRQNFIEVGNVSTYDDYLSKRLMLKFETESRLNNLFVMSGTDINITKVIACMIEQTDGKLL